MGGIADSSIFSLSNAGMKMKLNKLSAKKEL